MVFRSISHRTGKHVISKVSHVVLQVRLRFGSHTDVCDPMSILFLYFHFSTSTYVLSSFQTVVNSVEIPIGFHKLYTNTIMLTYVHIWEEAMERKAIYVQIACIYSMLLFRVRFIEILLGIKIHTRKYLFSIILIIINMLNLIKISISKISKYYLSTLERQV